MKENNNISDRCNNTDNVIVFDKLKEIKKKENKIYCYYLRENGENREIVTNNYIKIVDPSYDQIFKKLFEEGNPFNGIEGKQRLISFLNSIIFPDIKNDPQIYEIERLSNENTIMNSNALGLLRYDILCKAKCKTKYAQKNEKSINIEMQLSCDSNLRKRLINYASTVYRLYNLETIVLCLVNSKSDKDIFATSLTTLITSYQTKKKVENLNDFKIIVLNLPELIEQMNNKKEILIENKKIEAIGRNWIKLLGIRNWGIKELDRFILPSEINFECNELQSTILMLKNTGEIDLIRAINNQKYIEGVLEEKEKEGEIKGEIKGEIEGKKKREIEIMINFFNQDEKLLENNMDKISDKEMKYSELEIKQNSKDRISNINRFIELLKRKRKIKTDD